MNCKISEAKSNYKLLGDYITKVNLRNKDLKTTNLKGLSMTKEFRESTSNIIGVDLSKYKLVPKNHFACDFMSVIRVHKLPVVHQNSDELIIVSPAYTVFKVIDENILNPEYLMMWFRRPEFDRYADFRCDSAIRGGFKWDELGEVELPIPSIEKQHEIVKEYNTVANRITLNETINKKLEDTAQALYKHWFVDFEFPNEQGKPYKSNGGKMVFNEELDLEIPLGWEIESFTDVLNLKGGGTPSTKNLDYWGGEIPFFTPKDVNTSYYSSITEKYITISGLENCSSKLYPKNTIFITARGTVGAVSIASCNMAMNQSCYAVVEDLNINYCYAHQLTLETLKSLINQASGAIFKALVTKDFNEFFLAKPPKNTLNEYKKIAEPIYNILLNKSKQIDELSKLKNLLLSKMSKVAIEKETVC
ncbi:restriction endonuclease subunit S [Tenacibaculum finnmarkense]|uniref:restriction endonuclease subunit S n=1 Tax=Tenacibaculum finnmarkense TaxID=2781243 RepID=UPI001EFB97A2|nr:restriction endonuclease subunit S [Tenacibaculum finnmarkense]MCG8803006.1 restriction endonuclease subunit S [Tenacibaculum finnmarkense]MCG8825734.1 restriction endonuclease subunit S [Tenacibaculum finnmarkense]